MFGQTFNPEDLGIIGLLVLLEGVLSIDNALVLGLLAKRLPKELQRKALTYGLVGAVVFRFLAIGTASYLLRWRIVKVLGGGYLLWVALQHFWLKRKERKSGHVPAVPAGSPSPGKAGLAFWNTVVVIELTDIAFAIDSILAAIALVGSAPPGETGPHPKLWVVLIGGLLGVILMRFAAILFIRLLERFPNFETSAYLLIIIIGAKLLVDWAANTPAHPHTVDFHTPTSTAFWIFWLLMVICCSIGFMRRKSVRA